ncbi:MAG: protein-disulfide reductase, partial [Sulfurimonas sp.]
MKVVLLFVALTYTLMAAMPSFLMPDEAFKPEIKKLNNTTYELRVNLGKDIYLYEDRTHIRDVDPDDGIDLHVKKPTTAVRHGEDMVYVESPVFELTFSGSAAKEVHVLLEYQGCSEQGLCYNPMEKEFTLTVTPAMLQGAAAPQSTNGALSESDEIAQILNSGTLWTVLAAFFGFGLFLALTPCVFPMIPILSSIIVSQGKHMSARRGFFLSLIYVLAMAMAYTVAGILAGVFGSNIQAALQNPVVLTLFALVFVTLAISMFGFFEIGIPHSWQTRISKYSGKAGEKGGVVGVAIMGFLSALIVGPCIAPPLAGALIYIGQTGDAMLGGAALFVMSLGMGVPLLIIGTGAGKFMPRPGGWMTTVTKVFGVMMLGIAIWMLSRIIPDVLSMLLWAVLLIVSAVYMGVLEPLKEGTRGFTALFKGLGLVMLLYGMALIYGALTGAANPLNPLEYVHKTGGSVSTSQQAATEVTFTKVRSLQELEAEIAKAKGKRIMVDFYADWCTSCKELEHVTFKDPHVVQKMGELVLIQADVTNNGDQEKALMKAYNIFGPPAMLFFDENGTVMKEKTIIGYKDPKEFLGL